MSTEMDPFGTGRLFEAFEYRLLYFRPSHYSDERIVVGLVSNNKDSLEAKFLSSPAAIDLMIRLFGEDSVEQFQFAAAEVRRSLAGYHSLDAFRVPTDLLVFGETLDAFTEDREGLLASILATASSLMRGGGSRSVSSITPSAAPTALQRDLFAQVNRMDPFKGTRIFDQKFTTTTGQIVRLPILGDRVFGAPLSFAAKEQMMKAESYVAKFRWLQAQMHQEPRIYLLAPETRHDESGSDGIRDLMAIAAASEVRVMVSESTEGMASQLIRDETADAA